jgi:hypothetical protein
MNTRKSLPAGVFGNYIGVYRLIFQPCIKLYKVPKIDSLRRVSVAGSAVILANVGFVKTLVLLRASCKDNGQKLKS